MRLPAANGAAPLLFGTTPPRRENDPAKNRRIAARRIERFARMQIDGLVLYDVQDESARTSDDRPFPYLPTIDPLAYARDYLVESAVGHLPRIIYRAVASHTPEEIRGFLSELDVEREAVVLVGAPSRAARQATSLGDAYRLYLESDAPRPELGGVAIPERHAEKWNEDERMLRKIDRGCTFFVSQCVYDAEAARNMLSDYHYATADRKVPEARVILTLSPCGSTQTLEFMKWLGIRFPRWLENDLVRTDDVLDRSLSACRRIAEELLGFCVERAIPVGFNVESVSIRREEIDAAEELVGEIAALLRARGLR